MRTLEVASEAYENLTRIRELLELLAESAATRSALRVQMDGHILEAVQRVSRYDDSEQKSLLLAHLGTFGSSNPTTEEVAELLASADNFASRFPSRSPEEVPFRDLFTELHIFQDSLHEFLDQPGTPQSVGWRKGLKSGIVRVYNRAEVLRYVAKHGPALARYNAQRLLHGLPALSAGQALVANDNVEGVEPYKRFSRKYG